MVESLKNDENILFEVFEYCLICGGIISNKSFCTKTENFCGRLKKILLILEKKEYLVKSDKADQYILGKKFMQFLK